MVERGLVQTGAASGIVGAAVLLVATLLHPLQADPGDSVAAFQEYAADAHWVTIHLGQFFGVLLMVGGLVALTHTLKEGRRSWIAQLAVFGAISSLATTAVLQAVDGVALKAMVDTWTAAPAPEIAAAFNAALAVRQIEVGMASLMAILFGVTVSLYGLAILSSHIYPGWTGWAALIAGPGILAGGLITAHTGFSRTAMTVAMPFNLLVIGWLIVMGVLMWRRAGHID